MKYIKLFENFEEYGDNLNEGLSPVLYHATQLGNAVSILRDNTFNLTNTLGLKAERGIQKKFYYISFARSLTSGYYYFENPQKGIVYFKIDGDKLGNRYKGLPVDYWSSPSETERGLIRQKKMENEDRVISDSPEIPNATSYIQEIYVYVGESEGVKDMDTDSPTFNKWVFTEAIADLSDFMRSYIRKLILLAKSYEIPIYMYWKKTDLLMNNKDNAVNLQDIDLSGTYNMASTWVTRTPVWITLLYKMYNAKTKEDLLAMLTSQEKDKFNRFEGWGFYKEDILQRLDADFSNLRSKNNQTVNKIVSIMKREGYGSIEEMLIDIHNKWYPKDA
jgi:hypothetical protein